MMVAVGILRAPNALLVCSLLLVALAAKAHTGQASLLTRLQSFDNNTAAEPKYKLPNAFQTSWTITHALKRSPAPPYKNGEPPTPYMVGSGTTYYDWSKKAILEIYPDFCVPIFVNGSNWKCRFLNTGGVSYLIAFEDRPSWVPECCIFGKPWYAPSPTFFTILNYTGVELFHNKEVAWYIKKFDNGLTFGYSFYTSVGTPAEFFFDGQVGWIMQDFFDFEPTVPPQSVWSIPSSCAEAKDCDLPH